MYFSQFYFSTVWVELVNGGSWHYFHTVKTEKDENWNYENFPLISSMQYLNYVYISSHFQNT